MCELQNRALEKACSVCKEVKDASCFGKSPKLKTGLRSECNACRKAYSIKFLVAKGGKPHRDKRDDPDGFRYCNKCSTLKAGNFFNKTGPWCKKCVQQENFAYRPDASRKFMPIVLEDRKQCCTCKGIKQLKEYSPSARGRLGLSSYCKSCTNKKPRDAAKHREKARKYRLKNLEHWRAIHRVHQYKRRYLTEASSDGTVTADFCKAVYAMEECFYCKQLIASDKRTLEHVLPLSRGGCHSAENIQMACLSCNCSKGNKTVEEFTFYKENHD